MSVNDAQVCAISSVTDSEEGNASAEKRSPLSSNTSTGRDDFEVDESLPIRTDVVIIGAGPAGLALAIELAQQGVESVILDHSRVDYPADPAREVLDSLPTQGIVLQAETLDILQSLGVMESITLMGRPLQGATVVLHGDIATTIPRFNKSPTTRFQSGIILEQWKLERSLLSRLTELGGKVYRNHVAYRMVIKVGQKSDDSDPEDKRTSATSSNTAIWGDYKVKLFVRRMDPIARKPHAASEGRWLHARYVVGADGVRSMTRRALEIEMTSLAPLQEYLCVDFKVDQWGFRELADAHDRTSALGGDENVSLGPSKNYFYVFHSKPGSCVLFPYANIGQWRMVLRREGVEANAEGFSRLTSPGDDDIRDIIGQIVPGTTLASVGWRAAYATEYRIADHIYKGRALIIGDAAHYFPPTWSMGLNTAILDAHALGWRLAAVVEGWATSALLEAYQSERREHVMSQISFALTVTDSLLDYGLMISSHPIAKFLPLKLSSLKSFEIAAPSVVLSTPAPTDSTISLSPCRVLAFQATENSNPKITTIQILCREGHHVLLLLVKILPSGTRQKTLFGCEREEMATRYSKKDIDDLLVILRDVENVYCGEQPLTKMLTSSKDPKFRPVWIITGLVNEESVKKGIATLNGQELAKQVPTTLKSLMVQSQSNINNPTYTAIDHECQVQMRTGIKLGGLGDNPAETWMSGMMSKALCQDNQAQSTTAFVLIRPDGKVAAMGHASCSRARAALQEYCSLFTGDMS